MKINKRGGLAAGALAVSLLGIGVATATQDRGQPTDANKQQTPGRVNMERDVVDRIIAGWTERPRLGAVEMMAKYGPPQEATTDRVVWHNAGPFKRITVFRHEDPHDFPLPHMDFLEHTITYEVPEDKIKDLIVFDGSSTINRTAGELSARCDLEGHNVLTLNLDHDIVTGKLTVDEARKAFGENVRDDVLGKKPPYVEKLQFTPPTSDAKFSDEPVMPGSPKRAAEVEGSAADAGGDAEAMAFIIAVDMNEVLAAAQASMKKTSPQVMEYARMLHAEHGQNAVDTMKLAEALGVTPINTQAVDQLYVKGAGQLAALVPLDGDEFDRAYIDAMVKGHTEALALIDDKLMTMVKDDDLKQHLTDTRAHIADHLEKAKAMQ